MDETWNMEKKKTFSATRIRTHPGSDLIDDLLTHLSWYPGEYSIHYISNWRLSQPAGYTMFRWFLLGRDNSVV